ncbi:MAG TPA: nuclear transport factor 2 family protein [Gemmatimonadaceae bacterium]
MLKIRALRIAHLLVGATLLLAASTMTARAQSDTAAVLATANNVFKAMHDRDTVLLKSVFDTSARLVGVSRRGTPAVTTMTPMRFGAAIMGAKAGDVWNEKMINPEVRIDGNIAQVWGDYTFHINNTFSHCGIDAFMLVKVGDTWKITQLADTERKDGCK